MIPEMTGDEFVLVSVLGGEFGGTLIKDVTPLLLPDEPE